MINKIFLALSVLFCSVNISYSQNLAYSKLNYNQQELFVNPAFAGSQDMLSATINFQKQWMEIEKSPSIQRLQAHMPIANNKIGLGLALQNESYGVTNNFSLSTHYAYRIPLKKGVLSLGLQVGFATSQERFSELHTSIPDPMFSENTKLMWGFSTGVGAYYSTNSYYIGLSVPHLIDNSLKEGSAKLANSLDFDKMPFYLAGGYLFTTNSPIRIKPAALLSYSGERQFGYNVSLTGYYNNKFWLGALARYRKEAGFFAGLNILDYVNLTYNYSFGYGELLEYVGRTSIHEVTLNVMLNTKGGKARFRFF